jgi:hypothetical protein
MNKIPPGFNVIPCVGKVPSVSWKEYTEKRVTADEMKQWDELYPGGDRGIVCGPISMLFVLDVDGEVGELSLKGYHLPKTVTVKTPHGKHYYFRWIPDLDGKVTTKTGILPKVDVRGEGGFVRWYGWRRGPHVRALLAPPQWLIDLLPNKNAPKVIEDTFKKLDYVKSLKELKELPRHNTLYSIAGGLRSRGYNCDEIYELILPKGREVGLPDNEIRYIADRMDRYPMGQRPPVEEVIVPENFAQFLQDQKKVEFLVPGIFPKNGIAFVAGLPETSKTWTLIDLAIEIARPYRVQGGMWLDHYPTVPGHVLYIDQERPKEETQRRFKALLAAKQLNPSDLNQTLTVKCGTTIRVNLEASLKAFRTLLGDVRPDVVIVDSYKTFHTENINDHASMQHVMEAIKALRTEFNCSFIFVYHENKGAFERVDTHGKKKEVTFENMAGALTMSEVAESIMITARQDQNSCWLHHVKNSYGPKRAPVLVSVEDIMPDRSQIRIVAR